ncbi:MAG TPA: TolC family protein [Rhodanobacteraceae bacterium]
MNVRRLLWLCPLLLGGCATYQPLPLNSNAHALDSAADIKVAPSILRLFPHQRYRFNPSHGLDMTDVAILAVANNPQLKLARDKRGIAHAQAFAVGLLPDPVLDLAHGVPTAGPSDISSFDLGLSDDVEAVLVHPLAKRAANESAREVDLNVLWMAWQVAGKARELFVRDVYQARMLAVLRKETGALTHRHARLLRLGRQGEVSRDTIAADLATVQASATRLHAAERQQLKTRQALDALLGLSPRANLHLAGPATGHQLSSTAIARALAALPHRRPDLLALKAGYRSADARYRQAILEQFPAIHVGFSKGRDTDGIYSRSLQISLTLPIFNRNRGAIAVNRATRKDLHDAYAVRLTQARAEVEQIVQDQQLLDRQRQQVARAATAAAATLAHLEAVAKPGDVSDKQLTRLQTIACNQRLSLLALDAAAQQQQTALWTLLGPVAAAGDTAP